ncbi:MAG: tripartite tricarboxylate transporter substrate binding protein [Burkholderiales bacterium]|nr:tripartite tricarboxylate transporter substrate binding protein [Burkholderiales bacterium]MEB2352985.1 tripartite tricarboxylate transporter substrate-binding protein [Burkholderiaceae bacterium]
MSLPQTSSRTLRLAAATGALVLLSVKAWAFEPGSTECIAPSGAGGGWDMTCRLVGKALQDQKLIPGSMLVTNKAGAGGGAAFAEVVNKRGADNNLIVAASSSTATRLAQGAYSGSDYTMVRWLGSIGTDYGVIGVPPDSPFKTLPELIAKVKADPTSVTFAGGSAVGGWDHLKVLIAAKKGGVTSLRSVKYVAFDGGAEAITQLMAGKVNAFTGDASEAKGFVDAGKLKVLAVLAPERLSGEFGKFPTAKEQGLDVVGANWRGFYVPGRMSDDAYNFWVRQLNTVTASKEWKAAAARNGMEPLNLSGEKFADFVKADIDQIQSISREIGIIK